jgi:DNA-binding GntR family transcriptional regulator
MSPGSLVNVRQRRLQIRDEAADHVRELILTGGLEPGSKLSMDDIASSIGASVTPVREALLLLAQDGLVAQIPHRGFHVAPVRRKDVLDTFLVYSRVVGELVGRAATVITPAAVTQLREIDSEILSLGHSQPQRLEELNSAFHETIYRQADAPRLLWMVNACLRFIPRRNWSAVPGWVDFNRTHEPVIQALSRGDAVQSSLAASAHVDGVRDLLITHLDSLDWWRDHAAGRVESEQERPLAMNALRA